MKFFEIICKQIMNTQKVEAEASTLIFAYLP